MHSPHFSSSLPEFLGLFARIYNLSKRLGGGDAPPAPSSGTPMELLNDHHSVNGNYGGVTTVVCVQTEVPPVGEF